MQASGVAWKVNFGCFMAYHGWQLEAVACTRSCLQVLHSKEDVRSHALQEGHLDFTGAQMVLTLRLIAVAVRWSGLLPSVLSPLP